MNITVRTCAIIATLVSSAANAYNPVTVFGVATVTLTAEQTVKGTWKSQGHTSNTGAGAPLGTLTINPGEATTVCFGQNGVGNSISLKNSTGSVLPIRPAVGSGVTKIGSDIEWCSQNDVKELTVVMETAGGTPEPGAYSGTVKIKALTL